MCSSNQLISSHIPIQMDEHKKILVVENDEEIGLKIENVLREKGYEVCLALNGTDGIEKSFVYIPDLILCNVKIDHGNGFEIFNILKQTTKNYRIPFIFFSLEYNKFDFRNGMNLGADDFLTMSFMNTDLIKSVENQMVKYENLLSIGKLQLKALLELSPNYIFLFDGNNIYNANSSFLQFFRIDLKSISTYSFEEFFDVSSFEYIKDRIRRCNAGILEKFDENVNVILPDGTNTEMKLYVCQSEKFIGFSLLLGLLAPNLQTLIQKDHDNLFNEVIKVLQIENIIVSDHLCAHLAKIFK